LDYEAEKILGLDDILDEDLLDDYYHLPYPDAAMADKMKMDKQARG
jgi:hypothetical protein